MRNINFQNYVKRRRLLERQNSELEKYVGKYAVMRQENNPRTLVFKNVPIKVLDTEGEANKLEREMSFENHQDNVMYYVYYIEDLEVAEALLKKWHHYNSNTNGGKGYSPNGSFVRNGVEDDYEAPQPRPISRNVRSVA